MLKESQLGYQLRDPGQEHTRVGQHRGSKSTYREGP